MLIFPRSLVSSLGIGFGCWCLLCRILVDAQSTSNTTSTALYCPTQVALYVQPQYAVIFPWVVEILGVVVFFLLKHYHLPFPYAACMFIIGAAMGAGACHSGQADQLTISITQWSLINSEVLLLVFLPGLLFRDAIEINFNMFVVSLIQIVLLAFPMVLMGTLLVMVVGIYVLPFSWPWSLGATLGAILSSTDPVAVASVLKSAGAPPRLQMHISGESLLNDGSSIVFYTLFSQIFFASLGLGQDVSWSEGIALFFRESLGGIAVGLAFAAVLIGVLYELDRRLDREYDVLQVVAAVSVAYLAYYVADAVLEMSGIIATVTVGITSAAFGKGLINDEELMDSYLKLVEHLLNTLLFALGGAEWGRIVAGSHGLIEGTEWGYLFLLYVLVVAIRFVQMAVFYPLFSRIGLKSNWRESTFIAYGGLRGAVGIALAVSLLRTVSELSTQLEDQSFALELVFMSGGISLLTLSINGTLAGPVLRLLGLQAADDYREKALLLFELAMEDFVHQEYNRLRHEARFRDVNHQIIKAHVPWLKNDTILSQEEVVDFPRQSAMSRISLSLPDHTSLKSASETSVDATVIELRKVFLALLKEVYLTALQKGELMDEGFNVDALQQGVDINYACCETDPIHDWEYTEMFPYYEDARTFLWNAFHLQKKDGGIRKSQVPKERQLRIHLLRALVFIEAHKTAEKRLRQYVNSTVTNSTTSGHRDATSKALDVVLKESQMQVTEAEKVLERVPPEEMEAYVSHFVVAVILNRLSKFVEMNVEDGVLQAEEGQSYLDKINVALRENRHCQGSCVAEGADHHDRQHGMKLGSVVEASQEESQEAGPDQEE